MHCTIDGDPKMPEAVACQERHFGQAATGIDLRPYELRMSRAEFVALCGPLYNEHVGYEKDDEPFYRAGADTVIDRWHQSRYPQLDALIDQDPPLIEYLLRWRMGPTLLRSLFPLAEGQTRFILNSLETIQVGPDGVVLAGQAWAV
jgi:hypothetical protein